MTAVMRAMAVADGPRIPRIAIVRGGRVIEERLVKQANIVTIGRGEGAMFTIRSAPPSFSLLERTNDAWFLRFADGMSGRIATSTGIATLEQLRTNAHALNGGYRLKLTDDARGKIVIGDDTILFQLVPAPPAQPRPQLPLGVKQSVAGSLDWTLTIVAAFSFLLHFGIAGAMYSDWLDPVITPDHNVVSLIDIRAPLPNPPTPEPRIVEPNPTPDPNPSPSPSPSPNPNPRPSPNPNHVVNNGPTHNQVTDQNAARMAAEAEKLQIGLIGAVKDGPSLQKTLESSNLPPTDLSSAAQKQTAVTHNTSDLNPNSGGPVTPGKTSLSDIASTNTKKTGKDIAGENNGPAGPNLVVDTRPPTGSAAISDADSVIAKLRPRFRQCYMQGLDSNPGMSGKATMVVKVMPNGEVQSVGVGSNEGLSSGVTSCVARHLQNATFTGNGTMTTLNVPITFLQNK